MYESKFIAINDIIVDDRVFDADNLVSHIDSFGKGLSKREIKFIADMIDNPPRLYSPKQKEIIKRIYEQKC